MELRRQTGPENRSRPHSSSESTGSGTRAISTVLDAVLFLLLVGAATVGLFAHQPSPPPEEPSTATLVATTTAEIEFDPAGPVRDGVRTRRRGTLAELIAVAAVRNYTLADRSPTTGTAHDGKRTRSVALAAALSNATRPADASEPLRTRVTAVWEPYEGAPLSGRISIGPRPPPDADVHAETLSVPSGFPPVEPRDSGPGSNYSALAERIAGAVVDGLFPPRRTELALASERRTTSDGALSSITGDEPTTDGSTSAVRWRYRRFAATIGASIEPPRTEDDVQPTNRRLQAMLARTFEADLRESYRSPEAAREATRVRTVRLVVRTWSP